MAFNLLDIHLFGIVVDVPLIIQMLCISLSSVLLLGIGAKEKISVLRFILETVGLAAAFLLVNFLLGALAQRFRLHFGSYMHYFICIVLFAVFFGRHAPILRVVMASVIFSVTVSMASLGTTFGYALQMNIEGLDILWIKIAASLLTVAVAVVYYRYPLFRFRINRFDAALNIVSNLLSALLFVLRELWQGKTPQYNEVMLSLSDYMSVVIFFVFLINVLTYFMTYFLCRERERTLNYQMERERNCALENMLSLSEQKLTELREVRHDIKNQYAYMQSMLEDGRYDDLRSYFNELVGTFSKPLYDSVESGNPVVDSVLNLELSKAREAGLRLEVRAAVPSDLPFPQSALLGLFCNVIDNAVEACVREGFSDASVEVVVGMQGNYMFFNVSNPTNKTSVPSKGGQTEKDDKELHGYGMRIIRKIVKKYSGYYRCFVRDGKFVFESLLDAELPQSDRTT